MNHGPKIAEVACLVGEPARANMLAALLDGRALTASELASLAGVAPPTASGHLGKLRDAGLLALAAQGRHRYFSLASPDVARMLEAIMVVAQAGPARHHDHWRGGDKLRTCRTCYDHLAGRLAVGIAETLDARGLVTLTADGGSVTEDGKSFFADLGIALPPETRRRAYCRPCLDWSERRPHLAGAVGAAILTHALDKGWVRRVCETRALDVTPHGQERFAATFGVRLG